jgi:hypothetical protein
MWARLTLLSRQRTGCGQVKVKRRGDDQKFIAEVLAVGTDCDIALLTVADDTFWEGVDPLQFGPLPLLQEAVAVVGYPIGGDTISVTSGVVSRIEVTAYVHGSTELLGIQIDAAINSGNSGGSAFLVPFFDFFYIWEIEPGSCSARKTSYLSSVRGRVVRTHLSGDKCRGGGGKSFYS